MTASPQGVWCARTSDSQAIRVASHMRTQGWVLEDGWDLVRQGRSQKGDRESWEEGGHIHFQV